MKKSKVATTMPKNSKAGANCTCKPSQNCSSQCNSETCHCSTNKPAGHALLHTILQAIHNWFCTTLLAFQGKKLIKVHKIFQIKYTRDIAGDKYNLIPGSKEACQEGVGVLCAKLSKRSIPYEIITSRPISSPTNAMILVSVISKTKPWYYGIYAIIGFFYYIIRGLYELGYLCSDVLFNTPEAPLRLKLGYLYRVMLGQVLFMSKALISKSRDIGVNIKAWCLKPTTLVGFMFVILLGMFFLSIDLALNLSGFWAMKLPIVFYFGFFFVGLFIGEHV